MQYFERLPDETAKSYRAFGCYRDLGPERSIDKAYEVYSGRQLGGKRRAPRGFQRWSREHDWVARASAYDDFLEMERRSAICDYLREHGTDIARRQQHLQEQLLEVKKRLLPKLESMASWPLKQCVLQREEQRPDGTAVFQEIHVFPARWTSNMLTKAIATLDETPDKLALTDPAGQHEYGRAPSEIDEEFVQFLEELRGDAGDPDEEQRGTT